MEKREERASKLENRSIEINPIEEHRRKKIKLTKPQLLVGTHQAV